MKKSLIVTILALTMILAVGVQASASMFITKTGVGYMHNFISDLNENLDNATGNGYKDLFGGGIYADTVSLFGFNSVENFYWGIKNGSFFTLAIPNKTSSEAMVMLGSSSFEGVLSYEFVFSPSASLSLGMNAGVNLLALSTRGTATSFSDIIVNNNRLNLWRPYFIVGPSATLSLGSKLVNFTVTAGYYYNLGFTGWLDMFTVLDNSKDVLKSYHSVYLTLGVGVKF